MTAYRSYEKARFQPKGAQESPKYLALKAQAETAAATCLFKLKCPLRAMSYVSEKKLIDEGPEGTKAEATRLFEEALVAYCRPMIANPPRCNSRLKPR